MPDKSCACTTCTYYGPDTDEPICHKHLSATSPDDTCQDWTQTPGIKNGEIKMPEDFPTRLRKLREKQRKSQIEISELCGLHPKAVSRYEQEIIKPSIESLVALADYFGVSIDYLSK